MVMAGSNKNKNKNKNKKQKNIKTAYKRGKRPRKSRDVYN